MTNDIRVELDLGGTWTDITTYVYARDGIQIRRGRADEAGQTDPSTCRMTLDNRTGRFSWRNPTGAYYGSIGRNTPLRVSLPYGSSYLWVPGDDTDRATAPDSAALSITGDIDVRLQADVHWCEDLYLCGKWAHTSDERSWSIRMDSDGLIYWAWSTAGTSATVTEVQSTAPVGTTAGPLAVRVTHDVNNGASGNTVTFYTSADFSSWTQLGDAVTSSGTTSIYDGTASLEVGNVADLAVSGTTTLWSGARRILRFELRDGIGGTAVANPRFDTATDAAASFADTASSPNTWTMSGNSSVDDRSYRFCGEVSEWPTRWDITGTDVYVPIEAAGILRRLQHRDAPLDPPIRRDRLTLATPPVAYWPCEDEEGSTVFGSALSGGTPLAWTGSPTLASSEAAQGSEPLPKVNSSMWVGAVPAYTPGSTMCVQFIITLPAAGVITSNAAVMQMSTTGTARWLEIHYLSADGGTLAVRAYNSSYISAFASASGPTGLDGGTWLVSLELTQNGVDIDYAIYAANANDSTAARIGITDTGFTETFGRVTHVRVAIDDSRPLTGVTSLGHISVHKEIVSIESSDWRDGYVGEEAGTRLLRLAGEAGVGFQSVGTLGLVPSVPGTTPMGKQRPVGFPELIRECVEADRGMLFEATNELALGYRTRASLYNQSARISADYAASELADTLAPTDDDQHISNDVKVTRTGGSSARAILGSGSLSVLDPPDGVGTYDTAVTINAYQDVQLVDLAAWQVHVGTVDEERYPLLPFHLGSPALVANATLRAALTNHALGDRVAVANPPAWVPPGSISQLSQGYSEYLDAFEHTMVLNCSPESAYRVGVVGSTSRKLDTAGSELRVAVDADDTAWTVETMAGPIWTTDDTEVPFEVSAGGEVVTVTDITSAVNDAFTRTETSGWGTATTGQVWAAGLTGDPTDYTVNGSAAVMDIDTVAAARGIMLGGSVNDIDLTARVRTLVTATGGSIIAYLIGRYADASNLYLASVKFGTDQSVKVAIDKYVAGAFSSVAAEATQPGVTHSANTWYRVRFQISGSTLRARVWPDSGVERNFWTVSATDTSHTAGQVGVWGILSTGNSNTLPVAVQVDDFELENPQTFTVTRSANGVSKAHAAGTDVRLTHPMTLAL